MQACGEHYDLKSDPGAEISDDVITFCYSEGSNLSAQELSSLELNSSHTVFVNEISLQTPLEEKLHEELYSVREVGKTDKRVVSVRRKR